MAEFVAAIDQGTTSSRCMIFNQAGREVGRHQLEHTQIMPRPGWVEHDPMEIWHRTQHVVRGALAKSGLNASDLSSLGITNQRETTVVWNARTGVPYGNAIVWQDTRTDKLAAELNADERGELIRRKSGLPPATYFAGGKLAWLLAEEPGLRKAAEAGEARFGTIDSWLLWNLTGGSDGGVHLTDVTNASRTMLMNIESCTWDDELLEIFDIPPALLPEIRPSSDPGLFGVTDPSGVFGGEVPIAAVLGDQHAAMVGQVCLSAGDAKNTYGTGAFLLLNTGHDLVRSQHGLLSTVCYRFGDAPPVYALEGSVAVAGSGIQWLRDQLGIVKDAKDADRLAGTVPDNGGVYFVPAFSGLFAPYWRSDARGTIVGLSRFNTAAHLARATLESICFQSVDLLEAMESDSGISLDGLKVDGGVTASELCMQTQADLLGMDVVKPVVAETTALGAAYAAGLAVGTWPDEDTLRQHWQEDRRWSPEISADERARAKAFWRKAVERSLGWLDETVPSTEGASLDR